ncbi:hypothetical protein DRN50_07990 [Thermococci archaeon]|nr:MAG: hypothetical protein DRN50_07990 [Thermococci archaeon]
MAANGVVWRSPATAGFGRTTEWPVIVRREFGKVARLLLTRSRWIVKSSGSAGRTWRTWPLLACKEPFFAAEGLGWFGCAHHGSGDPSRAG